MSKKNEGNAPKGATPGGGSGAPEWPDGPPQRWTAKRRKKLVLWELQGEVSTDTIVRKYGVPLGRFRRWKKQFLEGAEQFIKNHGKSDFEREHGKRIEELEKTVGELTLDKRLLKRANDALKDLE